jgi:hypothetical protein
MGPAGEIADRLSMVQRIIVGIKGESKGAAACLARIGTVMNAHELPCLNETEKQFIIEYRSDTDIRSSIVQCLASNGYELVEIHSAPYTLEDTFMRLLEGQ